MRGSLSIASAPATEPGLYRSRSSLPSWDQAPKLGSASVLRVAGELGSRPDLRRGLNRIPGLTLMKLVCCIYLGMPKIGRDNPTFSKQLPALPGCFDVPYPRNRGSRGNPTRAGENKGRGVIAQGHP